MRTFNVPESPSGLRVSQIGAGWGQGGQGVSGVSDPLKPERSARLRGQGYGLWSESAALPLVAV